MQKKVLFIAPIYRYVPILVYSLRAQNSPHWLLLLYHDGPAPEWLTEELKDIDDRVRFIETASRTNLYGHDLRERGIETAKKGSYFKECSFIVHTNADNYYTPGTVKAILNAFASSNDAIKAIFFDCIHNYFQWKVVDTRLALGHVDLGSVAYRAGVAKEIGFPWREHSADWTLINAVMKKYGKEAFKKIAGVYLVHN